MDLKQATFSHVVLLAAALRLTLIVYGMYHDAHSALKYTDVDYRVFSDATRFIINPWMRTKGTLQSSAKGWLVRTTNLGHFIGDPYDRETYRYTPLLALLMIPNEFVHHTFGKVLFAVCDILIGCILYGLSTDGLPVNKNNTSVRKRMWWVATLWLLNPMPANISTRGSAESVLGLIVISTLALVTSGRMDAAAIFLGLATHFKIYPFIYGASVLAYIRARTAVTTVKRDQSVDDHASQTPIFDPRTVRAQARFAFLSFGSFIALNIIMYLIWGQPFLEHSYLYHLTRRDHRHNFSLYFYPTYLTYNKPATSFITRFFSPRNPLFSFIPQMMLSIGSGFLFGGTDITLAWFIQTTCFVHFNRVCTSQYFMWYIWFLPLILPRLELTKRRAMGLLALWVGAQALWLAIAYRLEFLGEDVFFPLWVSSVIFLCANSFVLIELVKAYR